MVFSLILSLLTSLAFAAPQVDPEILKVYQQDRSQRVEVPIIIAFQDAIITRSSAPSSRYYRNTRIALEQNAMTSQQRVCQYLTGRAPCQGPNVKSYWLTNTMIAKLNLRQAMEVAKFPEVISMIHAYRPISLVKPVEVRPVTQLSRTAQMDYTYGLKVMKVPEFRAQFPNITGKGINVGILDTGLAVSHPEFHGKKVQFRDFSYNKKPDPYDDHGHGTHVAGTIGGIGAGPVQIGVAPGVDFTIGKILDAGGSGTLQGIIEGMDWIADPDGNPSTQDAPAVINNSWGGGRPNGKLDPIANLQCKAIENWLSLGILPVFAAGNSGSGPSTVLLPGGCPRAFTIGATDEQDNIASFSSRGPVQWSTGTFTKPDVSAPGVKVISANFRGGYIAMSGTSMATPHAVGVAALALQANPGIATEALAKLMIKNSIDLGTPGLDNDFGYGRLTLMK